MAPSNRGNPRRWRRIPRKPNERHSRYDQLEKAIGVRNYNYLFVHGIHGRRVGEQIVQVFVNAGKRIEVVYDTQTKHYSFRELS